MVTDLRRSRTRAADQRVARGFGAASVSGTSDGTDRATTEPEAGRPGPISEPGGRRALRVATIEVEQPLGPGVDFEPWPHGGLVGRRVRSGGAWLGFDRAALVDSDDGHGRRLPVLVGLPASTFAGARLEVELFGGWASPRGPTILVGRPPGGSPPNLLLARIVANIESGAIWLDGEQAEHEARRARQRHRERESHARIGGGRAWHPSGALPPEIARFATPHSAAEYRLSRLPPRYLRGLEGLLDDDERMLYWVERPMLAEVGLVRRIRGRVDRRAALLALTDRQLLWIVDHAQPDRYLSDWGVDVESVPIERVLDVRCAPRGASVNLTVVTRAEPRTFMLPAELVDETGVMRDLIARFTPAGARQLPRRRYPLDAIAFQAETAARFGQGAEARTLLEAARRGGDVLAFLFSPRRPGQRFPAGLALREDRLELASGTHRASLELAAAPAISLTLSPLVGRLSFGSSVTLAYPAPLMEHSAAFARLARKALANLP